MVCVATTCIFRDCPTDRLSVWRILPRPSLLLSSYQHQPPGSFVYLSAFSATTLKNTDILKTFLQKYLEVNCQACQSCPKEEMWFLVNQNTDALFSTFHPSTVTVTSNTFSSVWRFRPNQTYMFWKPITLAICCKTKRWYTWPCRNDCMTGTG